MPSEHPKQNRLGGTQLNPGVPTSLPVAWDAPSGPGHGLVRSPSQGSGAPCRLPSEAVCVPEQRVSVPSIPRKDKGSDLAHST